MLSVANRILLLLLVTQEASGLIRCYLCNEKEFDFELTADTLPTSLDSCSNFTGIRKCYVTVAWDNGKSTVSAFHDILDAPESKELAIVSVLASNSQPYVYFQYLCSTDFCNTVANAKPALRATTIKHSLQDLVPQLNTTTAFDPNSCFTFQNGSVCSPSTGCQHCHITMRPNWKNVASIEICARCDSAGYHYFEYITYFDLIEPKRFDDIHIRCLTPNCNSLENVELVRQKTNFQFDYNKYFGINTAPVVFPTRTVILIGVLIISKVLLF